MESVLARQLNIPLCTLNPPIPTKSLNNRVSPHITHLTEPVTPGNHKKTLTFFFSFHAPHKPLILWFPWLELHNPHLDWSESVLSNCHISARPPEPVEPPTNTETVLDLSSVPTKCHDLQEVFSKSKALSLPPYKPHDCTIELLSGSTRPSSWLYNLSRPECADMEKYIK